MKYKKGALAERRSELSRLRQSIYDLLPLQEPTLDVNQGKILIPDIPQRGVDVKAVEDQLDSIICAYVAAHWWYWGLKQNQVLGDRDSGYIVVPNRRWDG